jgi:hypothetical protein
MEMHPTAAYPARTPDHQPFMLEAGFLAFPWCMAFQSFAAGNEGVSAAMANCAPATLINVTT